MVYLIYSGVGSVNPSPPQPPVCASVSVPGTVPVPGTVSGTVPGTVPGAG